MNNKIDIKRQEESFEKLNKTRKNKYLFNIGNGFDYGVGASAVEYDGKNKYIRITDIDDYSGRYLEEKLTSPEFGIEEKYRVKKNDILFARTGASVGKAYLYVEKDGNLYYAGFLIRVNINKTISSEYVFQYLKTEKYKNFISVTSMRSGQPGINAQELSTLKIPIHSNKTYKIADFLTSLDELIQKQEEYIEELKVQKKGYSQKIFNQELRFKRFEEEWVKINLKSISNIYQPETISKDNMVKDGKYMVFGANGYIGRYNQYNHKLEQVSISCRGENSGTVNFIKKETWITGNSMVVNLDNNTNVDKEYIYNYLKNQNLKYMVSGTSQPQITKIDVELHLVEIPILEEQKKIGDFLSILDDKVELQEQKLKQLKQKKKYYLNKIFQ